MINYPGVFFDVVILLLWLFRCDFEKFLAHYFCGNLVDFRFLDIKSKVFENQPELGE